MKDHYERSPRMVILFQVNLLMSELQFDDSPAAQKEYSRYAWQAYNHSIVSVAMAIMKYPH